MFRLVLVLAASSLAASVAWAQAVPAKPEPMSRFVVTRNLTTKDDAKAFPKGAPASGTVAIECAFTADGGVTDCVLRREDPPGSGLAGPAMELVKLFKVKPLDRDGKSVAGRRAVIGQSFLAPGDRNPDWVRRPTPETIAAVYPVAAMRAGRDGSATISCDVTVEGRLDRCRVVAEDPPGMGFGGAALQLAPQLLMTPKVRGGKPVVGQATIPINFRTFGGGPTGKDRLILDPPWETTPTAAQVAAAWPAAAKDVPTGTATLRCRLTRSGGLGACETISELPKGKGFGAAAQRLKTNFKVRYKAEDNLDLTTLSVDIPFLLRNPAQPTDSRLTNPRWVTALTPEIAEAIFPRTASAEGLFKGAATVDCAADAQGALVDCRVTREIPAGKGFGEAALSAAKLLVMNPWSKTGEPVEGRRLLLPIVLELDSAPAASEPEGQ